MPPNFLRLFAAILLLATSLAADVSKRDKAIHILNRITWGPRPGDAEALIAQGYKPWLNRQLQPESIEDGLAQQKLEEYPNLKLSIDELIAAYPDPLDSMAMSKVVASTR